MKLASLEAVFGALNSAGVRYVVVGGVAVNAHGYQRLTNDLDLVLHLSPENVLAALRALEGLGFRPLLPVRASAFADPEQRRRWVEERNLQVFSLVSDTLRGVTVDVFASEPFDFEVEHESALVAEVGPDLPVRFVNLRTLITMKEAAARPRDLDDAEHLRTILNELQEDERPQ
jgi:hypothetical protein